MDEPGKYDLLLTNQRRVRWLWWGVLLYVVGVVGLLAMHFVPGFWLFAALPLMLWVIILFFDKLFRQAGWALLAADGIAWANPTDSQPVSWKFAEIRSYRFVPSRNGIGLLLYLSNGEKATINGSLNDEFVAFWKVFEQTVRRYNQDYPGVALSEEKIFFERPISGKILLGLLATSAAWVAWSISQQATALAYFLVVLVLMPYLGTWAMYSGRRE